MYITWYLKFYQYCFVEILVFVSRRRFGRPVGNGDAFLDEIVELTASHTGRRLGRTAGDEVKRAGGDVELELAKGPVELDEIEI